MSEKFNYIICDPCFDQTLQCDICFNLTSIGEGAVYNHAPDAGENVTAWSAKTANSGAL